jgi:predicted nucleic acid-binding protein
MFANRFTALIDACVLVSPLKRNMVLSLAEAELFRVRWSATILDETQTAIGEWLSRKGHPDAAAGAQRARQNMEIAFVDAEVREYQYIRGTLEPLPDDGDGHVIAAAIKCRADVIVTDNLKDFPSRLLDCYGIEPKSSDEFLADTIDLQTSVSVAAIHHMRLRFKKPELTAEALLLKIEQNGLTRTADHLREFLDLL